jgi:hypothetical protein
MRGARVLPAVVGRRKLQTRKLRNTRVLDWRLGTARTRVRGCGGYGSPRMLVAVDARVRDALIEDALAEDVLAEDAHAEDALAGDARPNRALSSTGVSPNRALSSQALVPVDVDRCSRCGKRHGRRRGRRCGRQTAAEQANGRQTAAEQANGRVTGCCFYLTGKLHLEYVTYPLSKLLLPN